jgi:prolipoprotein diacylglyceryltransferase
MIQPTEMILYAVIVLLGIGAAMVLAIWLINKPSDHHVRAARARAARRRR